ncbi:MAG: SpoIID/LytB domain-containing protein [Clostridia bacterium]|nr:SpoIID/LytB domain-containing protein [Clostridia bacterium]
MKQALIGIENMITYKLKVLLVLVIIIGFIMVMELEQMKRQHVKDEQTNEAEKQIEEHKQDQQDPLMKLQQDALDSIRVLIMNDEFKGIYHDHIEISSESEIELSVGTLTTILEPKKQHSFSLEALKTQYDQIEDLGVVTLKTKEPDAVMALHSVKRHQTLPEYRGIFKVRTDESGFVIVNELSLEEYLYAVVPSEMPAGYPFEALKAQAVCARTYALRQMQHIAYPKFNAHVDDSTNYQVYQNLSEQEETTAAVNETKGMVVCQKGELVETCYYSTSCGAYSNACVFSPLKNHEDCTYLKAGIASTKAQYTPRQLTDEIHFATMIQDRNEQDYEYQEDWYRWNCEIHFENLDEINRRILERFQKEPDYVLPEGEKLDETERLQFKQIREMKILKREEGGVVTQLLLRDEEKSVKLISQNLIRYVLAGGCDKIINNHEEESQVGALLPSAFFTFGEWKEEDGVLQSVKVYGGGSGHGGGMSQNAAKCMAQKGMRADQILECFYHDIEVITLGENE